MEIQTEPFPMWMEANQWLNSWNWRPDDVEMLMIFDVYLRNYS